MSLKRWYFLFLIIVLLASCTQKYSTRKRKNPPKQVEKELVLNKPSRKTILKKQNKSVISAQVQTTQTHTSVNSTIQLMLNTAISYLGTPYKYSGMSPKGMDCSGLMYLCFQKVGVQLGRSAQQMANQGQSVSLDQIRKGDLLFFRTTPKKQITHVGMVIEVGDSIKFIHSSTSQGVVISGLDEPYWKKRFVKARRFFS